MYRIILLLIAGMLSGCKGSPGAGAGHAAPRYTVDMTRAEAGTAAAALSVARFLKLQTTDRSLINQVVKVIPYRDRLYILTAVPQNEVLIFSDDGAFITKITKGRAKNEAIYPTDITIDPSGGHLLILDFYRQVKTFTLDGKYVSQYTLSDPQFHMESIGKNGKCVFYSMNAFPKNRHAGYYGNGERELQGIYASPYRGKGNASIAPLTKISQDSLLLSPLLSDTVYLFNPAAGGLDPCFVFDFKGLSANAADKIAALKDLEEYGTRIRSGRLYSGPLRVHFVKSKLFFAFYGSNDVFYVYDTRGRRLTAYSSMFEELPNHFWKIGQDGAHVICAYDIGWLKKHFQKNPPVSRMGKEISALCGNEDENPVLIFANIN